MSFIDPRELIAVVLAWAGLTKWGGSKAMGRAGQYLDAMARRGSIPSIAVAAELCDVCGCDLVVRDRATGEDVAVVAPSGRVASQGADDGEASASSSRVSID